MAAVLHDVVEDTTVTLEQLRAQGFPESVIEAVEALTKRDGEYCEAFIRRVAPNSIVRKVKLADLRDNADLSRIAQPTDKDRLRIEKYQTAIDYLARRRSLAHLQAKRRQLCSANIRSGKN